jgi:four helix bundle protein
MNIALEKSRKFAIRIYNLSKYLTEDKREYVLAKQILRSGTSIGANLSEAKYSISRKEFLVKTKISLKETAETEYWIRLLRISEYIDEKEHESLLNDCLDIKNLLTATLKTAKSNKE